MSDIAELEGRLSAALDRIANGVGQMGAAEPPQALIDELAAEREANAQLEARVAAIKEKQETMVATLQDEVNRLNDAVTGMDADLQRLKSVNSELRATNAALRTANAAGLPDADLVNAAMSAEVDALRALEAGNRAEIDRALGMLEPMLKEAAHA
jgi:chromosome segregation ATPase